MTSAFVTKDNSHENSRFMENFEAEVPNILTFAIPFSATLPRQAFHL